MINPFTIMKEVEEAYGLEAGSIVPPICPCDCVYSKMYKPKRSGRKGARKAAAEARREAMWLVREATDLSFKEIGEYFDASGENVRYNYKKAVRLKEEGN